MINFKSESANKTQQNNAKIMFGSKGVSILAKLEEYSKEKSLDTAGIDALLNVLKTKDTALLEKFVSSKTGKTLVSNCKKLASAKTFAAIIKNVKAIKPLKSFDKFTGAGSIVSTSAPKGIRGSSTIGKGGKTKRNVAVDSQDPSMFATALDLAGDSNGAAYRKVAKQITDQVRKFGSIPRSMDVEISPYSVDTEGYFLEIYTGEDSGENIADIYVICLGGIDANHPNVKKWAPKGNNVSVIQQVDFDDVGDVKRMDFKRALKFVVSKNK